VVVGVVAFVKVVGVVKGEFVVVGVVEVEEEVVVVEIAGEQLGCY
jgi:hypothetical protein